MLSKAVNKGSAVDKLKAHEGSAVSTLRTGKYTGDAGRHRYLLSKSPPQIEGGLL